MYCYDKKIPRGQMDSPLNFKRIPTRNSTIQLMDSIKDKRKIVPKFTNIIHQQHYHEGYPPEEVEKKVKDCIGWSVPYSPSWGRFYTFTSIDRHVISFSVAGDTATVHHAGPFGEETTAQL